MPNHITNILTISGEEVQVRECLFQISSNEKDEETGNHNHRLIDFNKIIPRPKSLDITSGSRVDQAIALLQDKNEYFEKMLDYPWVKNEGMETIEQVKTYLRSQMTEKDMEEGRMALHNIETYGCKDWYDWSCLNWGTKWNAYDQDELDFGVIRFDTAWSTPYPVIKALAETFPNLDFEVKFADEDLGSNCGTYKFVFGVLESEYQPEGTEALKYACQIKGYEFEEFLLDNFGYWELDTIKEHEDTIIQMLQNGNASEFMDRIDEESEQANEKIEYIKQLAIANELYEDAAMITKMLGNE